MTKVAQIATFIMVVLSISFFMTCHKLPQLKSDVSSPVLIIADLEVEIPQSETENDSPEEIEFHETEFFITNQKYVFSPTVGRHLFFDNLPVFLSSYIFTIYVPPLLNSLS